MSRGARFGGRATDAESRRGRRREVPSNLRLGAHLGLAFAVLLPAAIAAAPAGAATKASCAKTGDTVLRNSTARIYDIGQRVYACHFETRRRTLLTRYVSASDDPESVRGFVRGRLAGRFVAFGDGVGCDRLGDCSASVRVVDTRTGAGVHRVSVIVPAGTSHGGKVPGLPALHLRRDGSAAFLIGPSADAAWEVWRLTGAAGPQRLDAGDVDARSMAVSEDWIYWRRDGRPFSAPWDPAQPST